MQKTKIPLYNIPLWFGSWAEPDPNKCGFNVAYILKHVLTRYLDMTKDSLESIIIRSCIRQWNDDQCEFLPRNEKHIKVLRSVLEKSLNIIRKQLVSDVFITYGYSTLIRMAVKSLKIQEFNLSSTTWRRAQCFQYSRTAGRYITNGRCY